MVPQYTVLHLLTQLNGGSLNLIKIEPLAVWTFLLVSRRYFTMYPQFPVAINKVVILIGRLSASFAFINIKKLATLNLYPKELWGMGKVLLRNKIT